MNFQPIITTNVLIYTFGMLKFKKYFPVYFFNINIVKLMPEIAHAHPTLFV